jgi:hypothetical protein
MIIYINYQWVRHINHHDPRNKIYKLIVRLWRNMSELFVSYNFKYIAMIVRGVHGEGGSWVDWEVPRCYLKSNEFL